MSITIESTPVCSTASVPLYAYSILILPLHNILKCANHFIYDSFNNLGQFSALITHYTVKIHAGFGNTTQAQFDKQCLFNCWPHMYIQYSLWHRYTQLVILLYVHEPNIRCIKVYRYMCHAHSAYTCEHVHIAW